MSELRPVVQAPDGHRLRVRRLGVDTQYEPVVFMHKECAVCRSEGFIAHNRLLLRAGERHVIATLYQVTNDLIAHDEAALSESAWSRLELNDGDTIAISHSDPLASLSHIRSRIYGNGLSDEALLSVTADIVNGKYSDIHLSSFITACAARPLDHGEVLGLTKAMVDVGGRLSWNAEIVLDKHSVGGLPGNRTTPIIVPIIAALGLTMPKTSSRAITSPAGTADTMETMAPGLGHSGHSSRRRTRRRMHRLGRRDKAQPRRRHPDPNRTRTRPGLRGPNDSIRPVQKKSPPARRTSFSICRWVRPPRSGAGKRRTPCRPGWSPLPTRSGSKQG